jgi:predicted nucleotidyltransferase
MKFGLKDTDINKINEVFTLFKEVEEVILYGSRAKGNFRKGSDIDLTMKGAGLNLRLLNKVTHEIDELLLPYIVDLSIFDSIDNKELIDHINRVGIVIYSKMHYSPLGRG